MPPRRCKQNVGKPRAVYECKHEHKSSVGGYERQQSVNDVTKDTYKIIQTVEEPGLFGNIGHHEDEIPQFNRACEVVHQPHATCEDLGLWR